MADEKPDVIRLSVALIGPNGSVPFESQLTLRVGDGIDSMVTQWLAMMETAVQYSKALDKST